MVERQRARARSTQWASTLFAALWLAGCTSNRFEYANNPRRDRESELAEIDRRVRQVPNAPTLGVPGSSDSLVASTNNPTPRSAETPPGFGMDDTDLQPIPAATYPPTATSPPPGDQDLDAIYHDNPNRTDAGINNQPQLVETPRPGPKGTILAPQVTAPQILGRVVNLYGRPEPNASIQVFDLTRGRRLVAELASGPDGRFNARNLESGVKYEIVAGLATRGMRYTGTTVSVAPDASAVIRLEPENRSQTKAEPSKTPSIFGPDGLLGRTQPASTEPILVENVKISSPRITGSVLESAASLVNASASVPSVNNPTSTGQNPTPPKTVFATSPLSQLPVIQSDGTPANLGQLAGDLILLDFFGSWCQPCRACVPHINQVHYRFAARGLHVVGIACEYGDAANQLSSLNRLRQQLNISYTTLLSTQGSAPTDPILSTYNVRSFPTFILIDRQGRELFRGQGASPENLRRLEAVIENTLGQMGK